MAIIIGSIAKPRGGKGTFGLFLKEEFGAGVYEFVRSYLLPHLSRA